MEMSPAKMVLQAGKIEISPAKMAVQAAKMKILEKKKDLTMSYINLTQSIPGFRQAQVFSTIPILWRS
jgi:hypothetical protein